MSKKKDQNNKNGKKKKWTPHRKLVQAACLPVGIFIVTAYLTN